MLLQGRVSCDSLHKEDREMMREIIIAAIASGALTLPALAQSQPNNPVEGAVQGTVEGTQHIGQGAVQGAGQAGSGIVKGTGTVVQGVGHGKPIQGAAQGTG